MEKDNPQKIIIIVGPTASGKSALAIKMAKKYKGEIISADSRQVYKGMDIGTGKVTKKEQKIIKHHLIDVVSPKKVFTADDFNKLGQKSIDEILAKNKIPIIAGGTGFYIHILLKRKQAVKVPPNPKLRAKLEKQSAERLFTRLQKLDPQRAKTIDFKNKHRLIRALEIVIITGKPVPEFKKSDSRYNIRWIGLNPKNLDKKIKLRLEKRLKQGIVKEVQKLHQQGVSWKRLDDLGLEYKWVAMYLKNKISYEEMKDKLLREIIKYSKRQMTWFKRNKEIIWNPRV